MRDEDKPFVCYRHGWAFRIEPRNAAGWRAFALWTAAYLIVLASYLWVEPRLTRPAWTAALIGFLIFTIAWAVAMTLWSYRRSEIIDLAELTRLKRDQDRSRRRSS